MRKIIFEFFLFYFLTILSVFSQEFDSKCSKSFCEDFESSPKCEAAKDVCKKNPDHTEFAYPDTCNCCKYCLKNLQLKDTCLVGQPGAVNRLEMCGPGLQCINGKCVRINNVCTRAQDDYDKRKIEGDLGVTEVRPQCDNDGFYKPVHCIPGSICYCVSPITGERIFGEMPYLSYEDERKMICGCSLNAWKAQQALATTFPISVARCTEIGTYDQLQCTLGSNSTCYCINSATGLPITEINIVKVEDMNENYPCFDRSRHTPGKYQTVCETEYEHYSKSNTDKDLNEMDFCQPDGKFTRVDLFSSYKKTCVDPDGRQIGRYEAEIDSEEAKIMDCNCARTHWLLSKAGVVELPTCCPNGNFEAWQCRRKKCFCVDGSGDQVGVEVNHDDLSQLECYKSKNGNPCLLPATIT